MYYVYWELKVIMYVGTCFVYLVLYHSYVASTLDALTVLHTKRNLISTVL
jgi:hypothetical protein